MIKPGEYFVAVKGEVHDGHDYIENAIKMGAKGFIEEEDLYRIAELKIKLTKPMIIGITGSTGKSSVTSFIYQLLSSKRIVAKGTLNTKLGLSTDFINNAGMNCEIFVAEMGMNGLHQIDEITKLFTPHIAVITNVNRTHLELLGNIENIAKAKSEIISNMGNGDILITNKDNKYSKKIGRDFTGKVLWYGINDIESIYEYLHDFKPPGLYNKLNLVASILAVKQTGMLQNNISKVIPYIETPKGRLNIIAGINGSTLIDDTYNASPVSTRYALDTLNECPSGRKIAILGDMLELGKMQIKYHKQIGYYANEKDVELLITVGKLMEYAGEVAQSKGIETKHIHKSDDFKTTVLPNLQIYPGDVILIKGSQGIRMEKITELLMSDKNSAENILVRQDIRWKHYK